MTMFKDRKVKESKSTVGQFMSFGIQKIKLTGFSYLTSSKESARKAYTFEVEGPEIGGDFDGFEGAKGMIAKVGFNNSKLDKRWFNPELDTNYDNGHKEDFLDMLVLMADKAGVRDQLDELKETDWDSMLDKFIEIMEDKYIWAAIATSEYEKGKFSKCFATGISGKNEDGYLTFSPIIKHTDFIADIEDVYHKEKNPEGKIKRGGKNNIILSAEGINVVGEDKGNVETIHFDPAYHFKGFESSDSEPDSKEAKKANANLDADILNAQDDDLPF